MSAAAEARPQIQLTVVPSPEPAITVLIRPDQKASESNAQMENTTVNAITSSSPASGDLPCVGCTAGSCAACPFANQVKVKWESISTMSDALDRLDNKPQRPLLMKKRVNVPQKEKPTITMTRITTRRKTPIDADIIEDANQTTDAFEKKEHPTALQEALPQAPLSEAPLTVTAKRTRKTSLQQQKQKRHAKRLPAEPIPFPSSKGMREKITKPSLAQMQGNREPAKIIDLHEQTTRMLKFPEQIRAESPPLNKTQIENDTVVKNADTLSAINISRSADNLIEQPTTTAKPVTKLEVPTSQVAGKVERVTEIVAGRPSQEIPTYPSKIFLVQNNESQLPKSEAKPITQRINKNTEVQSATTHSSPLDAQPLPVVKKITNIDHEQPTELTPAFPTQEVDTVSPLSEVVKIQAITKRQFQEAEIEKNDALNHADGQNDPQPDFHRTPDQNFEPSPSQKVMRFEESSQEQEQEQESYPEFETYDSDTLVTKPFKPEKPRLEESEQQGVQRAVVIMKDVITQEERMHDTPVPTKILKINDRILVAKIHDESTPEQSNQEIIDDSFELRTTKELAAVLTVAVAQEQEGQALQNEKNAVIIKVTDQLAENIQRVRSTFSDAIEASRSDEDKKEETKEPIILLATNNLIIMSRSEATLMLRTYQKAVEETSDEKDSALELLSDILPLEKATASFPIETASKELDIAPEKQSSFDIPFETPRLAAEAQPLQSTSEVIKTMEAIMDMPPITQELSSTEIEALQVPLSDELLSAIDTIYAGILAEKDDRHNEQRGFMYIFSSNRRELRIGLSELTELLERIRAEQKAVDTLLAKSQGISQVDKTPPFAYTAFEEHISITAWLALSVWRSLLPIAA